jgi:ribose transport system substrate-binding protein
VSKIVLKTTLALATIASVCAACSSGSTSSASNSSASSSSAAAGKKIVYIPGLTGEPFYASVACGAKTEAQKLGASFSTQGAPQFDVTAQTSVLSAVIAAHPSAIMISITDPKALEAPLRQAKDAGIKVLTIDGDLEDTSIGISNIQSNNIEGGKLAADRMAQVNGGKGTVVVIDNVPGFSVTVDRQQGFKAEMAAKFPNINVLPVQYSNNDAGKAASIVTSSIAAHSDLSGVYTLETNNTEGAATGVRESNKVGQVHIVGYDSSDPIVKALRAKIIDGLIVQYPYGEGISGVQTLADSWAGKPVTRNQGAPFVVATPVNIDTPKVQQYLYKLSCSS